MSKPRVYILGKLPPPYYGPAVATQILLNSGLREHFDLIHIDTKINREMDSMGKISLWKPFKAIWIYLSFILKILIKKPDLILIPNGQTTTAFIKDSFFILTGRLADQKFYYTLGAATG